MRITVLGKSPSWQDAGGACSGYLVEEDATCVLVDCGSGVLGKLREVHDHHEVDAVLLTHLHADHVLDIVPYAYGLTFSPRGRPAPIPLHAPVGALGTFRRLAAEWGMPEIILDAFDVREYEAGAELALGGLRARLHAVSHYVPTCAVELTGAGGERFTFGADTGPDEGLAGFADGTDLLMLEATILAPEPGGVRGHLTPREAGEIARQAGARRLVVTHFSDELDPALLAAEAEAGFGGPVTLAEGGAVYEV